MRLESLHKKNLVKAKNIIDDSVMNQLVQQVSPQRHRRCLIPWPSYLKNLNQKMALRKQLKNVKIQNAEQLEEVEEEVEITKVVISTLNGLPWSWDSFMQRMYARSKWLLSARLIRREEEDGSNWRSISHHSKKIPQAMRNMKNSILEEPLIHLIIWIRNDDFMIKMDSTHETNKI